MADRIECAMCDSLKVVTNDHWTADCKPCAGSDVVDDIKMYARLAIVTSEPVKSFDCDGIWPEIEGYSVPSQDTGI